MRIDTTKITNWKVATKNKSIKAKPLVDILVDKTIINKFLINTIEGNESLGKENVICLGQWMDAWQQTPKKLLSKYNVVGIDENGWMDCEPKPDNEVNCIEITREFLKNKNDVCIPFPDDRLYNMGTFVIEGLWGNNDYPKLGKNIQWGHDGDFICQNQKDLTDVWIVNRKIFLNTYLVK